ncbi:unnamed protein product, partial [Protopolystoma xenopodis]
SYPQQQTASAAYASYHQQQQQQQSIIRSDQFPPGADPTSLLQYPYQYQHQQEQTTSLLGPFEDKQNGLVEAETRRQFLLNDRQSFNMPSPAQSGFPLGTGQYSVPNGQFHESHMAFTDQGPFSGRLNTGSAGQVFHQQLAQPHNQHHHHHNQHLGSEVASQTSQAASGGSLSGTPGGHR